MEDIFAALSPEEQREIQDLTEKFDDQVKNHEFVEEVGGGAVGVRMKYPGTVTKIYINCEFDEKNKAIIEDLIVTAITNALKTLYAHEDELIKQMNDHLKEKYRKKKDDELDIVKRFGDKTDDKETLN